MEACDSHVLTYKKTQHVLRLLLECHPSIRKTQQSNLSQNNDVNIMFWAKKYTVASEAGVAFTLALASVAHARHVRLYMSVAAV